MKKFIIILLVIFNITLSWGQRSGACYEKIYQSTDTLPILISSAENIKMLIKASIKLPDSLLGQTGQTFIKYVINCRGEVVNLRSVKTADSDGNLIINKFESLTSQIIEILGQELKWNPAIHQGKTVDFSQIFSIGFKKGEIWISLTAT